MNRASVDSVHVRPANRRWRPGADLLLTLGLAALFAWALWASLSWPFEAAVFPRIVTSVGLALAMLHLLVLALQKLRPPVDSVPQTRSADDDAMEMQELEYEFAHAGKRAWLVSLSWIAGFFVAVYVVGLFIAATIFALCYLRLSGKRSWWMSVTYALITALVLYFFFDATLHLSMPLGIVQE